MPELQEIRRLVLAFDEPADLAAMKSRELVLMLLEHSPAPLSRNNFAPGHVTCTGMVSAPDGRLLLIHHRRLDRWLLPGGHVEPEDETAADAARREVIEETGASLFPGNAARLAGIDVHGIPPRRNEPFHLHHDLVFAFRAASAKIACSAESRAVAWTSPSEWERYSLPGNVRRAWARAAITKV